MTIIDLFSKRQQRLKAGQPTPYYYDPIPQAFRVQVVYIWRDALGPYRRPSGYAWGLTEQPPLSNKLWELVADSVAREWSQFHLGRESDDPFEACQRAVQTVETDKVIDLIEGTFRLIDGLVRSLDDYDRQRTAITVSPDAAIYELNHRFHEHGLGYQYIAGVVIREDSAVVQREMVEPAINLLRQVGFAGPDGEYRTAHEHYRQSRYPEAITEANKAFESTMKAICVKRKWPFNPSATAKPLLQVLLSNGLISPELQAHFEHLQGVIEAGSSAVRNKSGRAHGAGLTPIATPDYLAAYVLHLVAANILLLVRAHLSRK